MNYLCVALFVLNTLLNLMRFNRNHLRNLPFCLGPCGPLVVVVGLLWLW